MVKQLIGRIDKADFPLLGLYEIAVKIDTGAFTSSIHCVDVVEENDVLKCNFLDEEHPDYNGKPFVFQEYETTMVKSSNGIVQKRYKIKTKIILFETTHDIYLTLSDREEMKFPVLLGRKFLNKKFIVDSSLTNLSYKRQHKK